MEIAKVMSKGQVTIPVSIRKKLNIKEGDKIVFLERDGDMVIANSAMLALTKIQDAYKGEAERLGLTSEDDIANLVHEVRAELKLERAGNK